MLSIKCPIPDCPYETFKSSEAVTCAMLAAHATIHMAGPPCAAVVINGPELDRPKENIGMLLEEWNIFKRRWDVFVSGSGLDPTPRHHNSSNAPSMAAMKSPAVIVVATGVMRAELVRMQQEREESFRAFATRLRGKAQTWPTSPSVRASAKCTSLTRSLGTC